MKNLKLYGALVLLAGCASLHSPPAEAATVTVTWVNPTLNTDDTPIDASYGVPGSLSSWRIEYGTCVSGAFGVKAGEVVRPRVLNGPELTTAVLNLNPQTVCIRVLVTSTFGAESTPSNVVTHVVPAPTPRSPTGVTAK